MAFAKLSFAGWANAIATQRNVIKDDKSIDFFIKLNASPLLYQ